MAEQDGRRTQLERRTEAERRVIDAAVRLIARKGSRAVTLGEVGREAGYSRGIVHHHFGSREQLLDAVVRHAQRFDVPATEGTALDRLTAVVRAYLDMAMSRTPATGAFLLLWAESVAADPVLEPLFAERDTAFRADLADVVAQGVADGSIRADADPTATGAMLVGLLRGLGMQLLSSTGTSFDDGLADRTAAFVRAALAGPTPPGGRVAP
ncbi:TetR/AcrR family transcriptional regulator [Modestobacter versicolor]|uniref:AcrR family transcriptional regulator n=1 Tax=Modestobacter versicolor TaxID=429133 RepID=A0A323VCX6_9ACTN|nr:TetR family transcriptional regulator [Modestobacter versicolor]MBB3677483.1 AcrR family transcriptional regulator [Modestobacter versicolor]PZA22577.1 TetR/AcrR family transcriptional regulator [Modestobacter versicolor]